MRLAGARLALDEQRTLQRDRGVDGHHHSVTMYVSVPEKRWFDMSSTNVERSRPL
jgi:hypothetical protein